MFKYSKTSRSALIVAAGMGASLLMFSTTPAFALVYQDTATTESRAAAANGQRLDRLLRGANTRLRERELAGARAPVVRIVSPLNASTVAPGISTPSRGSPNGTGFVINVEIVTRDSTPISLREATLAPPVFGNRNVPALDANQRNPDIPGFGLFFDVPLVAPDGKVFPAFHNFASAFNVSGTDDTPGPGVTAWLGWHVLESMLPADKVVTVTATFEDTAGRVGVDQVRLNVGAQGLGGQSLTPPPESLARPASRIATADGPELSLIAPRVPSSIAVGPTGSTLNATNGSLFFIHLSAVDRTGAGIAVSETGFKSDGTLLNPTIPFGLIFDPSAIPNAGNGNTSGPNRNVPGLNVSFDVPLRQPNGNVVPAGTNLAGLFDIAGSEIDENGRVRTTFDWVVGGALQMPTGKQTVTISASLTDNAGRTGTTSQVVTVSQVLSGQDLTATPRLVPARN